ncbi:hypothetical protein EK904_010935, partial [Melospiza melodia maxima]
SWLTVRYSLPKAQQEASHEHPEPLECPPAAGTGQLEEGEGAQGGRVQCRNVLKIRRRKMNKHKYRKLLKRRKFIRRRVKEGRKRKRQVSPHIRASLRAGCTERLPNKSKLKSSSQKNSGKTL